MTRTSNRNLKKNPDGWQQISADIRIAETKNTDKIRLIASIFG